MCEQCEKLERRFFTEGSVKGGVEVAAAARLEPCCSTCWLGCRPALAHLQPERKGPKLVLRTKKLLH